MRKKNLGRPNVGMFWKEKPNRVVNGVVERRCNICQEFKALNLENFARKHKALDFAPEMKVTYQYHCRTCANADRRALKEKKLDKVLQN